VIIFIVLITFYNLTWLYIFKELLEFKQPLKVGKMFATTDTINLEQTIKSIQEEDRQFFSFAIIQVKKVAFVYFL